MKQVRSLAAVVLAVALLAGCGRRGEDQTAIQKTLEEKGTVDLMDQVSKSPEYLAPGDGRLTEGQVEMYIDVRGREQEIREAAMTNLQTKGDEGRDGAGLLDTMKAVGDLADLATADLRAAVDLGFNPKEYQWVKDRVLEAQMLETTQALNVQVARSQESLLAVLEKQARETSDDEELKELNERIRELQRHVAQAPSDMTPAKAFNAELIIAYRDDLQRLHEEDQRIAEEMRQARSRGGDDGR